MGDTALDRIIDYAANTEEGRAEIFDRARGGNALFVDRALAKIPRKQRRQISLRRKMGLERELRRRASAMDLGAIGVRLKQELAAIGGLRPAAARGQLNALREDARDWFNPERWEVHSGLGTPFILGDCCVIAINGDGTPGAVIKIGPDWRRVLLPISPTQILVGYNTGELPMLIDADAVNLSSAELSDSALYASSAGDRERALAGVIGTRAALLGDNWRPRRKPSLTPDP